ncbi:MAG TPA: nucleotidyltransferase domain-containing protein [Halanaerobiales bacterium]|nr:nucleotidyltransferase domain-containing protein [Halanaerobiales bacterium]
MIENFEKLKKYFSKFDVVKAAYLFGSYATGNNNKMSDIDIAVLVRNNCKNKNIKIDMLKGLVELGYDDIDLVILNRLSIVGKYEVVKHNKILYKSSDFDANSYFSLVVRKYLDFKPLLKVQREYLKERILNA